MGSSNGLSINEWAVLGLLAEGQTHGFAVSTEFAANGSIGKIWTIPRPLVYRAITLLIDKGLVTETGRAPGAAAPQRRLVAATDAGSAAVDSWLGQPVTHVRDARPELLIKLLLLDRSGADSMPLLVVQAASTESMLRGLRDKFEQSSGFDSTIIRWRLYSTEMLGRFLDDLINEQARQRG